MRGLRYKFCHKLLRKANFLITVPFGSHAILSTIIPNVFIPGHPCTFLTDNELPFADVLTPQDVYNAFAAEDTPLPTTAHTIFNPAVVLSAWLCQILAPDKSCRAAVLRIVVLLVALERSPCSADTAAYCRRGPRSRPPSCVP